MTKTELLVARVRTELLKHEPALSQRVRAILRHDDLAIEAQDEGGIQVCGSRRKRRGDGKEASSRSKL